MRRYVTRLLAALVCLCLAPFAGARSIAVNIDDPMNGQIVEIETIFGMPPTGDVRPRLTFMPNALLYSHLCYPATIGRNGMNLGGPVDISAFGPRPAIECIGLDQDAVNIAFALSRAGHIDVIGPNRLAVMRGNDAVMTLRLLNPTRVPIDQ